MMIRSFRTCLPHVLLLCLCLILRQAQAQTNPPPAGMSQAQYDELVKSVGQSVLQTLAEKGLVAKSPAAPAPANPSDTDAETLLARKVVTAFGEIPGVLAGYPAIGSDLARLPDRLDLTAAVGRGTWSYLGLVALAAGAGLLAEGAVRRLTGATRDGLARQFSAAGGAWRVAVAAILDGLSLLALWAVIHLGLGILFAQSPGAVEASLQTQLAAVVLKSLVAWRAYVLLFRIYLRPAQPALRIAPVGDMSAHRLFRLFDLAVIVAIVTQAWSVLLATPVALDAADLTNSVVLPGILICVVLQARREIAGWFAGLIDDSTGRRAVKAAIALHWHWIALPILIALTLARIYDALSVEFTMPSGAILTLNILVGLLLAETLLAFIVRSGRAAATADSGAANGGRLLLFLVRAVRATLWVPAAAVLVRSWAVDVLALIDEQEWRDFRHGWATSIITALGAYLAWEAVHFATEPRGGTTPALGPQSEEKREAGAAPPSASRLETLAPILRLLFGTIIIVTAALMILGSLGISITPFIAGASVIGLAISFGSQTLVHDIVSGLFYLADDAFRVGEYIDVGKAKGTVEGFTLRSIRLRHQSGQIHTIPFGQLGQITNFSRDWTTLKFNLRFDRNTDIEKLRKTTKKVGLAITEDPELKDDIIEPLKLQGVADIDDIATIMRFKITVHPTRPSFLQREAVKRLIAAFKETGIEFAGGALAVAAAGAPSPKTAAPVTAAAASKPA